MINTQRISAAIDKSRNTDTEGLKKRDQLNTTKSATDIRKKYWATQDVVDDTRCVNAVKPVKNYVESTELYSKENSNLAERVKNSTNIREELRDVLLYTIILLIIEL